MPEALTARNSAARRRPRRRAAALRQRVFAGTAAGALLLLAGCGGSSGTTKAQYITKVNALCTSEHQQLTQLALAKTKLTVTLDRANAVREQSLTAIEAVKAPGSGAISPEWTALRRKALSLAKRISALGLGSRAARPLNAEYVLLTNRAEKIAAEYGLTACKGFSGV